VRSIGKRAGLELPLHGGGERTVGSVLVHMLY